MSGCKERRHLWAGRKRHSAKDIVGKLLRVDELAAEGKPARRSPPSWALLAATQHNRRCAYCGMDGCPELVFQALQRFCGGKTEMPTSRPVVPS